MLLRRTAAVFVTASLLWGTAACSVVKDPETRLRDELTAQTREAGSTSILRFSWRAGSDVEVDVAKDGRAVSAQRSGGRIEVRQGSRHDRPRTAVADLKTLDVAGAVRTITSFADGCPRKLGGTTATVDALPGGKLIVDVHCIDNDRQTVFVAGKAVDPVGDDPQASLERIRSLAAEIGLPRVSTLSYETSAQRRAAAYVSADPVERIDGQPCQPALKLTTSAPVTSLTIICGIRLSGARDAAGLDLTVVPKMLEQVGRPSEYDLMYAVAGAWQVTTGRDMRFFDEAGREKPRR